MPKEVYIIFAVLIIIFFIIFYLYFQNQKKQKLFIAQVVYTLIKEKMENVQYYSNKSLYNVSFQYNNINYYIKIFKGGKKKGFIMTNPSTLFLTTYTSKYGPSKSSEHAKDLTRFLIEPLEGKKIILIKDNMLRITKYINENELEEVKYNIPSFKTHIVQEKDFLAFIEFLKNKKK